MKILLNSHNFPLWGQVNQGLMMLMRNPTATHTEQNLTRILLRLLCGEMLFDFMNQSWGRLYHLFQNIELSGWWKPIVQHFIEQL